MSCSVDNHGGGKDYPHIDVSKVVLCFCTERWFTNSPCIREVVRAVLRKKPLIALLEPDTTEQHGGFTEAQCRAILRDEMIVHGPGGMVPFSERLQDLYEEVGRWSEGWAEPVQLLTAKEIEDALFASAPIIWSPLADFQDVSLRMIAERTLPDFEHAYGSPYQQMTYVQGEIETRLREFVPRGEDAQKPSSRISWRSFSSRRSTRAPRQSVAGQRRAVTKASFHLYVSNHNPRGRALAKEIAALLSNARLPPLRWTDDPEKLNECEHMLVHLDGTTWTRGVDSDAFAHDICEAMRAGVHRLLAHEVSGARLDDVWRCGCSFDDLIEATPMHLRKAGIYNEIAMNMSGGEWRMAGLSELVRAIYKGGGPRKQWLAEPNEPRKVNCAQRPISAWKHSALRKAVRGRTLGQTGASPPGVGSAGTSLQGLPLRLRLTSEVTLAAVGTADAQVQSALQENELLKATVDQLLAQLESQSSAMPVNGSQPVTQPIGLTAGVPRVLSTESESRTMRRGSSALLRRPPALPQASEVSRTRSTLLPAP